MTSDAVQQIAKHIEQVPFANQRRLIAIAGAPASGKSTLAEKVSDYVAQSCVVPMDGFHLDNALLEARELLHRKGAPETFDAHGLLRLVHALKAEDEVFHPLFDRARDIALAGAGVVSRDIKTVIVEGNYILSAASPWDQFAKLWDFSVFLDVPKPVLHDRLLDRWMHYGFTQNEAFDKAQGNDFPNADFVINTLGTASLKLQNF